MSSPRSRKHGWSPLPNAVPTQSSMPKFGPCRTSERELVHNLINRLEPGMLVLADRGFYGFDMWTRAAARGADLLWRVEIHLFTAASRDSRRRVPGWRGSSGRPGRTGNTGQRYWCG